VAGKILKGAFVLTAGQSLSYGLSFVRNLILARILSRADFGLAATFALAINMLEMASRVSLGKQVIQAKDGESPRFIGTAHSFLFLTGAISTVVILAASIPLAHLFKVPDKAWAFALLAFVPLCRGLENLDNQRQQRDFKYLPSILIEFVPQAVMTVLTWPLALWIGDYRVVVILILGKAAMSMLAAHLLAKHSYRWAWERTLIHQMWRFSWPLLVNGLLMFAVQQGDQIMVGSGYSLSVLGLYAAGASLVAALFQIVAQVAYSILLPLFSRLQSNPAEFRREYRSCVQLSALAATVVMTPLVAGGEQLLHFLYGPKYLGGGVILVWLAAAGAFRFIRIAPAAAAMAMADTQNQMIANAYRSGAVLLGLLVVVMRWPIFALAACGLVGEVAATVVSTWRLKRKHGIDAGETLVAATYLAVWLGGSGLLAAFGAQRWPVCAIGGAALTLVVLSLISFRLLFPESTARLVRALKPVWGKAGQLMGRNLVPEA